MAQDAEPPVGDARLQFGDRRMEAARIGNRQHDPRPHRGVERALGAGNIERERLFDEDGLARRGGALDLWPVLAVRCCKDDGIDRRVGEERIKIVRQRNAVLSAKALGGCARAGVAGGETDCGALALHGIDQHPSPPPDTNNRGMDHFDFLLLSVDHRTKMDISPVTEAGGRIETLSFPARRLSPSGVRTVSMRTGLALAARYDRVASSRASIRMIACSMPAGRESRRSMRFRSSDVNQSTAS